MSISSTNLRERQLPAESLPGGSGAFIFDPHTRTVQAITAARQSKGEGPSKGNASIGPRADAGDSKNAELTSREHSKTELQRLNQTRSQIKVHEIIDDYCKDDSMELNMGE